MKKKWNLLILMVSVLLSQYVAAQSQLVFKMTKENGHF